MSRVSTAFAWGLTLGCCLGIYLMFVLRALGAA